jgi:isopentenyl-diphosphate delta-isomerase
MPADDGKEVFEIVNEQNIVIGTELRKIVHATGLLHRAVYCFVFNKDGKLLLQQRSAR